MEHHEKLHISCADRASIREQVVRTFLREEPGTGKGDDCSVYRYEVEQLADGRSIFLKRPAVLNKGFDFEVYVSDTYFGSGRRTRRPSHRVIFEDLRLKQQENPIEFEKVKALIRRIHRCEEVRDDEIFGLNFKSGFPIEMVLKIIKWLFIEQDVTYWNWSGRDAFFGGIEDEF